MSVCPLSICLEAFLSDDCVKLGKTVYNDE